MNKIIAAIIIFFIILGKFSGNMAQITGIDNMRSQKIKIGKRISPEPKIINKIINVIIPAIIRMVFFIFPHYTSKQKPRQLRQVFAPPTERT